MEGSIRRALRTNRGSLPETAFSSCFTCSLISVEDQRRKKKNVTSNSFYSLPLLTSSSREPLKKMWPVTFALIGLSSTYGCHTILRYNQETKKNKARVEKRVEGDRKRKGKKMRKKTNTWRFIKFLHRKTF